VATANSFTAAAVTLSLTQSTLTKTIRELEIELGLTLFERSTRRVSLTSHGDVLLPIARRLLNEFDLSLAGFRERAAGSGGIVSVASDVAFASTVLPRAVRALQLEQPNIFVNVIEDTSGGVLRRVEAGEVDFGIGSHVGSTTNIVGVRHLLCSRLGVLFPPDFEAIPDRVTLDELHRLPLLRDPDDSGVAATLRKHLPELWSSMSRRIVVTHPDLQAALVREGAGVAIVSALTASHAACRGLPFKPIELPHLERNIHVFTRRGAQLWETALKLLAALNRALPTIAFANGVSLNVDGAVTPLAQRDADACTDPQ
jgi:DNA-binding transcriptional LysR family regulator